MGLPNRLYLVELLHYMQSNFQPHPPEGLHLTGRAVKPRDSEALKKNGFLFLFKGENRSRLQRRGWVERAARNLSTVLISPARWGGTRSGPPHRGAEGPGFLNPKSSDKSFNFPEPGTSKRPLCKPGPSPAFCWTNFFISDR